MTQSAHEDIYFFRPHLPKVSIAQLFEIDYEQEKLRVRNTNVNCLYSHLTKETFDEVYNRFLQYLNLDFGPFQVEGKVYQLNKQSQNRLVESIITGWIYCYTLNNLEVDVKRSDFGHPYMVDHVLHLLDKKFGIDTSASLVLGAKILRLDLDNYKGAVKGRRRYYNK